MQVQRPPKASLRITFGARKSRQALGELLFLYVESLESRNAIMGTTCQ